MKSNIFKSNIDNEELKKILYDFLNLYCIKESEIYILNNEIFKKYKLNDKLNHFFKMLENYYLESKKYFLKREITFNILTTILRHINKYLNITFSKKIIYNKNKYNIEYYINYRENNQPEIFLDSIPEEAK